MFLAKQLMNRIYRLQFFDYLYKNRKDVGTLVSVLYFLTFILSAYVLMNFLFRNKKIDSMVVLLAILIVLNCCGYFLLGVSTNLTMALWANRISYIGGIFAPFVANICLMKISEIKIPTYFTVIMTTIASILMVLIFTTDYTNIYYSDVSLVRADGYSYLIKNYGQMHSLYSVFIVLNAVSMLIVVIYAIRKCNNTPKNTIAVFGLIGVGLMGSYILESLLDSTVSYPPFVYVLGCILLEKNFRRVNTYDFSLIVAQSVERLSEQGFIIFDNKNRFVYANELLKNLFPEISMTWKRDSVVDVSNSFLYQEIVEWALSKGLSETKDTYIGDDYFRLSRRELYQNKKNIGILIEFVNRTDEKKYTEMIEHYNEKLHREVEEKTEHISKIKDKILFGMAMMIESRDNSTGGHIKRTSDVVNVFASHLLKTCPQFSKEFLEMVSRAAPMHDLGKIAIDDSILRKPGRFPDEEYQEMQKHSKEGARIVRSILQEAENDEFVVIAENVAHYHHEKWDGQGYPEQLAGEAIPLEARIMALADVFDALVSKRCYKDSFSYDKAFEIIEESIGTHFDPYLATEFIACRKDLEILYDGYQYGQ